MSWNTIIWVYMTKLAIGSIMFCFGRYIDLPQSRWFRPSNNKSNQLMIAVDLWMCWTWLTKHSLERSDTENRSKEWGTFLRCNYLGCDFNRVQGLLMVGWFRYHIVSLTISIWRTSSKTLILQRGLPKLQHVFLNGMVLEEKQQYLEILGMLKWVAARRLPILRAPFLWVSDLCSRMNTLRGMRPRSNARRSTAWALSPAERCLL